ncbi:hypothetical protein DTW90_16465 [Neorhizobium sp. P12A]|uniref:class I SAM-dependent methyltransferase n=1 Tax=Neorhizobium sp. P12A TaxID=2268027 RepID=UPI0011EC3900|nr:class I SAM-dependent methyltransferase [Neorhizobium sp. P12A]KAA0698430.1 hypothetical protein DTW90_16465 [Neorhizobium sp. P12A]
MIDSLKKMPEDKAEIEAVRQERRLTTIRSIKSKSSTHDFWRDMAGDVKDDLWLERTKAAVGLVPEGRHVVDIGCGDMKVERFLPSSCRYTPLDIAQRDDRTIVVDLNRERLPKIDANFFVCLGVLEYLHDIPKVLRQLSRQFSDGLVSYHPLERSPARDRLAVGWVNALNSTELTALFKAAGFRNVEVIEYKPSLHFYRLNKPMKS